MPIIMNRQYSINGNYTDEQKAILERLIGMFRLTVGDDDPEKNILNKKMHAYSNEKIIRLLNRAMADINGGQPLTHFTIWQFAESWDDTLIVDGAVVFAMISEGILQLRNQVDFSDSGLTIGMFNKTQLYQGWVSFLLQNYFQAKADLKAAVVAKNQPSMFVGIGSEFGYYWW